MKPFLDAAAVSKNAAKLFDLAAKCSWATKRQYPDEWAAANRIYPPSSGWPGPRRVELTPYIRDFERAFGDPRYRRVVLVTSSQSGKTEALGDIIGECLDNHPVPVIYVGPSQSFVSDQWEPRFVEMIQQSTSLSSKMLGGVGSKKQKKTLKRIAGVRVRFGYSGSGVSLRSDPCGRAFVDELDAMARMHSGDDVLALVEARGSTYADFCVGITSTPGIGSVDMERDEASGLEFWKLAPAVDLQSQIWRLWQSGTRYHWAWPCLACNEFFIPRFSTLHWDSPADGSKITPSQAARTAHVVCPRCGAVHDTEDKSEMNARGVYVAPGQSVGIDGVVIGEPTETTTTASYWVSGLCSPFVSWAQRAADFVQARRLGDMESLRTVVNSSFGELFGAAGGDAPDLAAVKSHRGTYSRREIPVGVQVLVLCVDVQPNRLLWNLRGHGGRGTSWLIDYGQLWGETTEPPVWNDLALLLTTPVNGMAIKFCLVDSGFRPGKVSDVPLNAVYTFCRRFPRNVRGTKGSSVPMRQPIRQSKQDVTSKGTVSKSGLTIYLLDTDAWKSWVFDKIRWPNDAPGSWHLPVDVDDDYCRQILSESRARNASGRVQWIRHSRENHGLDLEAMQGAASHLLNMHRRPETVSRTPSAPPAAVVEQTPPALEPEPTPPPEPPRPPDSEGMRTIGVLPEPGSPWNVPPARHQLFDQHNQPKPGWVQRPGRGERWNDRF